MFTRRTTEQDSLRRALEQSLIAFLDEDEAALPEPPELVDTAV